MKRTALALGVLLAVVAWTASFSQAGVFLIPASDDVLVGQLQLPGGDHADIAIRDGGMITVRMEREDRVYGFAAAVKDASKKHLHITPFRIFDEDQGPAIEEIETATINNAKLGISHSLKADDKEFKLAIRNVRKGRFPPQLAPSNAEGMAPENLERAFGCSGGGYCCVSCNGLTVCASRVSMGCGVCTADFMMD